MRFKHFPTHKLGFNQCLVLVGSSSFWCVPGFCRQSSINVVFGYETESECSNIRLSLQTQKHAPLFVSTSE